jgi:inhibitor of KinA sporulation pathway (predicted exonuclease)
MRYVIVDLEATCWKSGVPSDRMEIIEIGAVLLESAVGPIRDEFSAFIRPVVEPKLSDFCQSLTTIRQEDVDAADYFYQVSPRFVEWIGPEPFALCSWGAYDLNQFRKDCQRHNMPLPKTFERHINLKKEFARLHSVRPMGMMGALAHLDIPAEGQHHRGIDDVRNIAKIAVRVLPRLEAAAEEEISRTAPCTV